MPGWGMPHHSRSFEETYHVYSVAYANRQSLEKGDKILLPPSAFEQLARLQVDYPMLFELSSPDSSKNTHCGVLEFTAEEGCCYIPYWMMQNLSVQEGSILNCKNVSLPKATLIKLQPQNVDFLEISNPRAVLEFALRNFSCVTVNDIIQIPYNNKNYKLQLKQVQPGPAACIIETDCNVDFDAPVGYVEPSRSASPAPSGTSTKASESAASEAMANGDAPPPSGTRIVDGVIVRNDAVTDNTNNNNGPNVSKTGTTGVQKNAAIPELAPQVSYWGQMNEDGSRLDGKVATPLKHQDGTAVDVKTLRAQAAERRLAALSSNANLDQLHGQTVSGETVASNKDKTKKPGPKARQSRIGNKFSKLKPSNQAFQGSAHQFHKK